MQDIRARTAVYNLKGGIRHSEHIVVRSAQQRIGTAATGDAVVPAAARERVGHCCSSECVVSVAGGDVLHILDLVSANLGTNTLVGGRGKIHHDAQGGAGVDQRISTFPAVVVIVTSAIPAYQDVVTSRSTDKIVSAPTLQVVTSRVTGDPVVEFCPNDVNEARYRLLPSDNAAVVGIPCRGRRVC